MSEPSPPPRVNGHHRPLGRKVNGTDPSHITTHAFAPRGEWWDLCQHCGLAEAAHAATTLAQGDRTA